jgi:DNA-binding MarR family transcriptional regulator
MKRGRAPTDMVERRSPSPRVPPSWQKPGVHPLAFEDFPGALLAVALAQVHRDITMPLIVPHGLGLPEWRTLTFVALNEPISASAIVARSTMDKALVSRAVRALEGRGALRRKPGSGVDRQQSLHTTAAGRRLFDTLFPLAQQRQARLLQGLSLAERKALYSALRRLSGR